MTKRTTATALATALALVVSVLGPGAGGSTHTRPAVLQNEEDPCNPSGLVPKEVLQRLRALNDELASIINDYDKVPPINDEELVRRLNKFKKHLVANDVINGTFGFMPPIMGVDFVSLLSALLKLDRALDNVRDMADTREKAINEQYKRELKEGILDEIDLAKESRFDIGELLAKSPCLTPDDDPPPGDDECEEDQTVPAGMLDKFTQMKKMLRAMASGYNSNPQDEGHLNDAQVAKRAEGVTNEKLDAIESFPSVFSMPFSLFYETVEGMTFDIEDIKRIADKGDESASRPGAKEKIQDLLERIKAAKEAIELIFDEGPCNDPLFVVYVLSYYMGNFNICTTIDTDPDTPDALVDVVVVNKSSTHTGTAQGPTNGSGNAALVTTTNASGNHQTTATVTTPHHTVTETHDFFVSGQSDNPTCNVM